jgi:hypothetical protein
MLGDIPVWAQSLILAIHLAMVNVACALPLIVAWQLVRWPRHGRPDRLVNPPRSSTLGPTASADGAQAASAIHSALWAWHCRLARWCVLGIVFGGLTGFVYGLIVWDSRFARQIDACASRVVFAGVEYVFSLVLVTVYWIMTRRGAREASSLTPGRRLAGVILLSLGATNLAYHFPPLLLVLGSIPTDALGAGERLRGSELRGWLFSPYAITGWLHFLVASAAFASLAATLAVRPGSREWSHAPATELEQRQKRLAQAAFVATAAQWLVGPLVVIFQMRDAQWAMMGGTLHATALLVQSVALSVILMWIQWRLVRRPTSRGLAGAALAFMLLVIWSMCALRVVESG